MPVFPHTEAATVYECTRIIFITKKLPKKHTFLLMEKSCAACFFENQKERSCLVIPRNTQCSESTTKPLERSKGLCRASTVGPFIPTTWNRNSTVVRRNFQYVVAHRITRGCSFSCVRQETLLGALVWLTQWRRKVSHHWQSCWTLSLDFTPGTCKVAIELLHVCDDCSSW